MGKACSIAYIWFRTYCHYDPTSTRNAGDYHRDSAADQSEATQKSII